MKDLINRLWLRVTTWLWQEFLAPRHKWRFKARIALRVNWLFFKRWWRETVSLGGLLSALRRPTVLLLIGLGIPAFMLWKVPLSVWFTLHNPGDLLRDTGVEWRFLIQPLLILIGVPSAFILWAFRDHNATSALENQRKDINLKEFQEIQLRAAGALDEKLPAKARETLQVAAIHQLRPFLRGEYGTSFRRPAWELLKALLATSSEASGYAAIRESIIEVVYPPIESESGRTRAHRIFDEIRRMVEAVSPDVVAIAGRTLISEEGGRLFRSDLPLERGQFDGIAVRNALLSRQKFAGASFVGADLSFAHLEGANLNHAHLEGAHLEGAHLEGADLSYANLEGADLRRAHLEGANLEFTRLDGAYLRHSRLDCTDLRETTVEGTFLNGAHLEGSYLISAHLTDNTSLTGAYFDDCTRFTSNWDTLSETERAAERNLWRAWGMIHVDEVKKH